MNQKSNYRTSQKESVLSYMKDHRDTHMSVSDVYHGLKKMGSPIGLTTVYRHLDYYAKEGVLTKYFVDETSSACYEYVGDKHPHTNSYHCKCLSCGKLIHIHCSMMEELEEHLLDHHQFSVDPGRIVFYGLCEDCQKGEHR